jgi:hypothetical protein
MKIFSNSSEDRLGNLTTHLRPNSNEEDLSCLSNGTRGLLNMAILMPCMGLYSDARYGAAYLLECKLVFSVSLAMWQSTFRQLQRTPDGKRATSRLRT